MFLVKWLNFGTEHNTWEPEKNLTADGLYTNSKITEYWSRIPRAQPAATKPLPASNLSTKKVAMKRTKRSPTPVKTRSRRKPASTKLP
jgi:hypothetical protein